ncbi:parathyroid hormone 4 [Gambusia affinis]|uniref:parathyroid hormone 4 n=1 Tax=Gambusia affinis TaxID=33528 RepID=UPI001CDBE4EE|nr:parathyroid hormone 4 [Gambusia affinis]
MSCLLHLFCPQASDGSQHSSRRKKLLLEDVVRTTVFLLVAVEYKAAGEELQKMQISQLFAVMVLVIFTTGHCQQNDNRRRAVTEHQLMHNRGRNIQSLKRLIWLSSAMEGLHTAQTRSAAATAFTPSKLLSSPLNPVLIPPGESPQPAQVQSMLRDFFYPHLNYLLDEEP